MTLARESRPPQRGLNVFAPELLQDPYPWYAEMRQLGVFDYALPQIPNARAVLLSHWADVQNVLRDARFGRAGFRQNVINTIGEGALADSYAQWFLFQDPPDHTRLRGLVSKAFTPRAVENMRTSIGRVVEELLDRTQGEQSFDLMSRFAYQVPVLVICDLLGVPAHDRGRFSEWSASLAKGLDVIS